MGLSENTIMSFVNTMFLCGATLLSYRATLSSNISCVAKRYESEVG